jgi:hypothetical protein
MDVTLEILLFAQHDIQQIHRYVKRLSLKTMLMGHLKLRAKISSLTSEIVERVIEYLMHPIDHHPANGFI